MQRIFIFDVGRCFGCNGCAAACANANHTPAGLLWRTLHKLPPHDGDNRTIYLSVSCNHCENPPCVAGCPANALAKRDSDGIVIHDPDKCLACQYCRMVCPYDAIKWDEASGLVSKCHFCHERLAEGREPACVETCFSGALKQELVTLDDLPAEYKKESAGLKYLEGIGPAVRFINSSPLSSEAGADININGGK